MLICNVTDLTELKLKQKCARTGLLLLRFKIWDIGSRTENVGPSVVRALPVRRCRRAVWETLWPQLTVLFLSFSFFFLSSASLTFLPEGVDLGCVDLLGQN
jgi:hypothetical protein